MSKKLDAKGLQDFLGVLASSGIGSGLPVFWAVALISKEVGSKTVDVEVERMQKLTGFATNDLKKAVKRIREAGHLVRWNGTDAFTITLTKNATTKLLGPWMIAEELDVDTSPVLERLNELMGTTYRMTPSIAGMLRARTRQDKLTVEDLLHVVEVKVEQWKGHEEMEKFLRPSTLFSPKAAEYAQERKRGTIKQEQLISKEDLSRMFAG